MEEDCELLFFDTFSHESCEELNLDLVQFPCPVYLFEIRVIPLGARVQADFPGGHRLGATNPSSFQLEFYVNDLGRRSACTFEHLGSLDYKQNVDIQFLVSNKILTDGLVLRGQYSTVTLAIYGVLTKVNCKERSPPPPPAVPAPQPVPKPSEHRTKDHPPADKSSDWDHHSRKSETPSEPSSIQSQPILGSPRFAEVPSIVHPKTEPHAKYASDHPQPSYSEPPPAVVYGECIPASVPSVPALAQYPQQYSSQYSKSWPSADTFEYTRPQDGGAYHPVPAMWDPKDAHPNPETSRPDHEPYDHEQRPRGKDRRDKPWDRDGNFKDDDRDRDYKKKERDRRSWDRDTSSDRYRERDRKESGSRDRGRELRDKPRSQEFSDRGSRVPKRPVTPPTPPMHSHTPQTPPDIVDKFPGGPRTPKEDDPNDLYPERTVHGGDFYHAMTPPDHRTNEPHYNLSEGEIQEGDNTEDDDGYEEIVSEEEIMSDADERVMDIVDMEYEIAEESWNFMPSFSPFHCELVFCKFFTEPFLTSFEVLEKKQRMKEPKEEFDIKNEIEELEAELFEIEPESDESLDIKSESEESEDIKPKIEDLEEEVLGIKIKREVDLDIKAGKKKEYLDINLKKEPKEEVLDIKPEIKDLLEIKKPKEESLEKKESPTNDDSSEKERPKASKDETAEKERPKGSKDETAEKERPKGSKDDLTEKEKPKGSKDASTEKETPKGSKDDSSENKPKDTPVKIKQEKLEPEEILLDDVPENKILDIIKLFYGKQHYEKWIEVIESMNLTTLEGLLDCRDEYENCVRTLIDWVIEGLHFDFAMRQPQTAYKVRHLKAGIHLAFLLFNTNVNIIDELLKLEVPRLLLQLFNQPYMVLPVKLSILRAIDSVLFTKQGYEFILHKVMLFDAPISFDIVPTPVQGKRKTCYAELLDILLAKQLTRAVVAASAVMEKIHLYELLIHFKNTVEHVVVNIAAIEQKSVQEESAHSENVNEEPMEIEGSQTILPLEIYAQMMITCLQKTKVAYETGWMKMAHPKRYLPARAQFECPKYNDPRPSLLRMFQENYLLENILSILSIPSLLNHNGVISAIRDLLMEFLSTQNGMLFLLSRADVVNDIQKILLQPDETRDENAEESIQQTLGLHLVYNLQMLLYIDFLLSYHAREDSKKQLDDPETVSAMYNMYAMVFNTIGRQAVINNLANVDNLKALMPFVQITGDEEKDIRLSKSVCAAYATELLMLIVHSSDNITYLESCANDLYNIGHQEVMPRLRYLSSWMAPAVKVNVFDHDAIAPLCEYLKSHVDDASALPPELITTLRILKHISIPPDGKEKELKYMYSIVQIFSNDGYTYLLSILQNICTTFLKPSHQALGLLGLNGILVLSIVRHAVSLLKKLLGYLIFGRKHDFKDLTGVPVFLETYALMSLVPPTSFAFLASVEVQKEIIIALMFYTQPPINPGSEDALAKSLWSQMMKEIFKYCQQTPRCFITSFAILSELLPLPLPLPSLTPLTPNEVEKTINYRKLWSAHMMPLNSMVYKTLRGLAGSICQPFQQLFRRICIQICDLTSATALVVVRAVLDALLISLGDDFDGPDTQTAGVPMSTPMIFADLKPCLIATARILNLLAYLVSHPTFKITLMHVLRSSSKVDEKYSEVFAFLMAIMNIQSKVSAHVHAQECVVSLALSLCDPDISLVTLENGATVSDVLANCLPTKEHMTLICSSLIHFVGNIQNHYATVLLALRTLVILIEHDYGFYHVRQSLVQNPAALRSLFSRLSTSFSKNNTDYLSVSSTALELLRLMVYGYEEGAQTGRSMLLPLSELASFFSVQSRKVKEKHEDSNPKEKTFQLLLELEKHLSDCASEEETIENLLEGVSSLILLLNEGAEKEILDENKDVLEPLLPLPEGLIAQFAARPAFVVGEVYEERLTAAYWLSLPVAEEPDQMQEHITVDFITYAEKYISAEFDLRSSLEDLCNASPDDPEVKTKDKTLGFAGKRKCQSGNNSNMNDGNSKRAFIAPMRGRGFSRASLHSTRANDPFRSRPPNTSRPPSMHVDDFVALESHHGEGSSQTQPKRQDGIRGRGRGFDRGPSFSSTRGSGGRFFSPPGPYGRRETSTRGGSRGTVRGVNSPWSGRSSVSLQKSPAGTNFGARPSSASDRYGAQFQSEARPSTQRTRDSYQDLSLLPPSPVTGRFSRIAPVHGHWQETRNKAQNQRFMSGGVQSRGSGRRDLTGRHNRSCTR